MANWNRKEFRLAVNLNITLSFHRPNGCVSSLHIDCALYILCISVSIVFNVRFNNLASIQFVIARFINCFTGPNSLQWPYCLIVRSYSLRRPFKSYSTTRYGRCECFLFGSSSSFCGISSLDSHTHTHTAYVQFTHMPKMAICFSFVRFSCTLLY